MSWIEGAQDWYDDQLAQDDRIVFKEDLNVGWVLEYFGFDELLELHDKITDLIKKEVE